MRQRKFKIAIMVVAAVAAFASLPGYGKVLKAKSTAVTGELKLECDSVDFRSDLVRVYGKLVGNPHTSNRVDSVNVDYPAKKSATDIDGVDMKRWFQWEEDGRIPVEIDFPAMKAASRMDINVVTPRGVSAWRIILVNKK